MNNFPASWANFSMKEVLAPLPDGKLLHQGWSPQCETYPSPSELDWAVLKTTAIQDGQFLATHNKALPRSLRPKPELEVQAGDLLITCAGPRVRCGVPCLVRESRPRLMISGKIYRFRVREPEIDSRYIEAVLRSPDVQHAIDKLKTGISESGLNLTHERFFGVHIPIAPSSEQRRIVSKIDTLSGYSYRVRHELDRIPQLVDRYKQAILAKAFSGDLTAEWRSSAQRDSWTCVRLSDLCHSISDGDHQAPPKSKDGIPFITIAAMNDGVIRLEKAARFVSSKYFNSLKPSRRPERGDVLFSVTGSIAIPALVSTHQPFVFQRHIAILKPDSSKIDSRYLMLALATEDVRSQALAVATGTAQLTIPLSGLRSFSIPVASIDEQQEVIRQVEARFVWIDKIAKEQDTASRLIDKLDQSILAKAFHGELVPQDANDEPAAKLLERIRAEHAERPERKGRAEGRRLQRLPMALDVLAPGGLVKDLTNG